MTVMSSPVDARRGMWRWVPCQPPWSKQQSWTSATGSWKKPEKGQRWAQMLWMLKPTLNTAMNWCLLLSCCLSSAVCCMLSVVPVVCCLLSVVSCLLSNYIMISTLKTAMNWGLLLNCWANTFIFSDSSFSRSCFVFCPKPWKEKGGVILTLWCGTKNQQGRCQDEKLIDW